ncbi:MAG: diguanylate cyclase domain-containing protein, partial [Luminiphilus sp.]
KRRDDWLVARLGGDEFIVTIPIMSVKHSKWIREKVIKDLEKKLNNMILCYGEESIFFGASIGYAEGDFSGMNSILTLAKKADRSMLSVKQSRHSLSQK